MVAFGVFRDEIIKTPEEKHKMPQRSLTSSVVQDDTKIITLPTCGVLQHEYQVPLVGIVTHIGQSMFRVRRSLMQVQCCIRLSCRSYLRSLSTTLPYSKVLPTLARDAAAGLPPASFTSHLPILTTSSALLHPIVTIIPLHCRRATFCSTSTIIYHL